MRIDIKEMVLEAPLFISGVNFGTKLPCSKGKVEMFCNDPNSNIAVIIYKNDYSFVKFQSATLMDPSQIGGPKPQDKKLQVIPSPVHNPVKAQISGPEKFTAQVSNPISDVPKKPGRPAKFQGQDRQGE